MSHHNTPAEHDNVPATHDIPSFLQQVNDNMPDRADHIIAPGIRPPSGGRRML